ncbi:MAG: class I SAM-dependent methyltransferase [Deltaproteobacteria bacterium]|nr:class I SAM-dependent methyltransferase [Deltaproteobacteria bacterium]
MQTKIQTPFDYETIRPGYYHDVLSHGPALQRAWHLQKFQRVIDAIPKTLPPKFSLLDVGCGPGSLISLLDETADATGLDISPTQIEWARENIAGPGKKFLTILPEGAWPVADHSQDVVTMIEVIEHLTQPKILKTFDEIDRVLKKGGTLIFTTPNYSSSWPILEWFLNKWSPVQYNEQHVTLFTFFNLHSKLKKIVPWFGDRFRVETITTSHFIAPFLAPFSLNFSNRLARRISPKNWAWPFGNLCIGIFKKL